MAKRVQTVVESAAQTPVPSAAQRHGAITDRLNQARSEVARLAGEIARVEAEGRDAMLSGDLDPGLALSAQAEAFRAELVAAEKVVSALDSVERELSAARLRDEHEAQAQVAQATRDECLAQAASDVAEAGAHLSAAKRLIRAALQAEDVALDAARDLNTYRAALGYEALTKYVQMVRPASAERDRLGALWAALLADGRL